MTQYRVVKLNGFDEYRVEQLRWFGWKCLWSYGWDRPLTFSTLEAACKEMQWYVNQERKELARKRAEWVEVRCDEEQEDGRFTASLGTKPSDG
jgi:hypothetical protein